MPETRGFQLLRVRHFEAKGLHLGALFHSLHQGQHDFLFAVHELVQWIPFVKLTVPIQLCRDGLADHLV